MAYIRLIVSLSRECRKGVFKIATETYAVGDNLYIFVFSLGLRGCDCFFWSHKYSEYFKYENIKAAIPSAKLFPSRNLFWTGFCVNTSFHALVLNQICLHFYPIFVFIALSLTEWNPEGLLLFVLCQSLFQVPQKITERN